MRRVVAGSFGAEGGDEDDGAARRQVGLGQAEQRVVARVTRQAGQHRIVQVVHAGQLGHHPGQRAGRDVEIEHRGVEARSQGHGQGALPRRRGSADQDGGEPAHGA
jgi:hypothetical protein